MFKFVSHLTEFLQFLQNRAKNEKRINRIRKSHQTSRQEDKNKKSHPTKVGLNRADMEKVIPWTLRLPKLGGQTDRIVTQYRIIFKNIQKHHIKTVIRDMKDETKDLPDRIEIINICLSDSTKTFTLKNSMVNHQKQLIHCSDILTQTQKHKLFISIGPNQETHKLETGDFVKLGRVQFVVLQISDAKKTHSLDYQEVYGSKQYIFHLKAGLQGACKICLSDQVTLDDPLVNPCNCKGSCGVIHLECLKNWINNKVKRDIHQRVRTYYFEKFACQICMAPFPSMIRLENGNQILLLNFERPTTPYVLLEQCSQTQQKLGKTLHFILQEEGQRVNIGRGAQCELNISDISVSRIHSFVTYQKDNFYIHDSRSKFGTLIQLRHELPVNNKSKICLQHNGCIIRIQKKEKKASSGGKRSHSKNL